MLYIIEGIDKCGKSTFIERQGITQHFEGIKEFIDVARWLTKNDKVCIHFDSSDKNPRDSILTCAGFSHICDIYMDRCWISEMTYGAVYRGEINLEPSDEQYIIGLLQDTPHIIYYFDKQIAEPDSNDDLENNIEKVKCLKTRYGNLISRYSKVLNIYKIEVML